MTLQDWFGLKVNGEVVRVVNWTDRVDEPTLFDFDYVLGTSEHYEVVLVTVDEVPQ